MGVAACNQGVWLHITSTSSTCHMAGASTCHMYVYHMYITCILHVYHMYITCISHVYHMYITCISHVGVFCVVGVQGLSVVLEEGWVGHGPVQSHGKGC